MVVAVGAVYSGLGNKFSVRRSYLLAWIGACWKAYLDALEVTADPISISIISSVQEELDNGVFVICLPKWIQYYRSR